MLSEAVKNLVPYTAGEQPQDRSYIKLNTNENPYPPPESIKKLLGSLDTERLKFYPDPLCSRLREKLGSLHGLPPERVFVSNGSDEVLSFCFYAFFDRNRGSVLFPAVTYSFYPVYCSFYNLPYIPALLNPDFSVSIDRFLQEAANSSGLIFPNPNAPTGILLEPDKIESLLSRFPQDKAVIIDEAYIDFGGKSALPLLDRFPNLVIVRTFSKGMSLAGLRIGYALGSKEAVNALFTVKDSFNSYPLDYISQEIACHACDQAEYFRKMNAEVANTRTIFTENLVKTGWQVLPSQANFVFARKPGISGGDLYLKLKERGILVRHFNKETIDQFVRITIGTPADMDIFLHTVSRFLN